jgi:hypothetical protein
MRDKEKWMAGSYNNMQVVPDAEQFDEEKESCQP